MRLGPDDLARRLGKDPLPPAVLLFGEEPLLVEESARRVRHAAREHGFTDRIPLSAETGFDWGRLSGSSQTLSLFAERRLIELRLPTGRPGDPGAKAFSDYCERADQDVLLLVLSGRLDAAAKHSKWVKTLDNSGWVVEHAALKPDDFQRWFRARLRSRGVVLDGDAVQRLCHFLEGNLLAAAQEVDRLALFAGEDGRVDHDAVSEGLVDHARFNVFTLADVCLQGDTRRALRILNVLQQEGTEPVLATWALSRELHTLARLEHGRRSGESKGQLFKRLRVWSSRTAGFNAALARLPGDALERVLRQLARCDRVLKGREAGAIWRELDVLVMMMCDSRYGEQYPSMCHAQS